MAGEPRCSARAPITGSSVPAWHTSFRKTPAATRPYAAALTAADVKWLELDEKKFRYLVNEDAMATEKTAEGIRKFAGDIVKLEKLVASKLS